jgi:hypothetical protein
MARKLRQIPSRLCSQYLLEIRSRFAQGWTADLDVTEVPSELVLDEELHVFNPISRGDLHVYQLLTIWGDQTASYEVRENVRKRADRLIGRLDSFPLVAEPVHIVTTFQWAKSKLRLLSVPPGSAASDQLAVDEVVERWASLSGGQFH